MKSIGRFLLTHGFAIMMIGFVSTATSLLLFMNYRYRGGFLRTVLLSIAVGGVALYVIGRILVFMQGRLQQKKPSSLYEYNETEKHT